MNSKVNLMDLRLKAGSQFDAAGSQFDAAGSQSDAQLSFGQRINVEIKKFYSNVNVMCYAGLSVKL